MITVLINPIVVTLHPVNDRFTFYPTFDIKDGYDNIIANLAFDFKGTALQISLLYKELLYSAITEEFSSIDTLYGHIEQILNEANLTLYDNKNPLKLIA